ncbi:zinc ribbon domain-containing protein [Vibrio sp. ZSDZ34]|jgi:hypothetical protein|uniref:Zinc ribbon domain-containing protein n=1 Tax=Vibrio gelatinilyticus TaxID=2893468 RepID=A0A9X1WD54_9VIBR|nr:zinc ribbon domain-containing protein [Vibrio gelatinilyticus]MCJ2378408.1 zinc ribbon domain-containing protein [Vibrio gelatinilyticus]
MINSSNCCPTCHSELEWRGEYFCTHCDAAFSKQAHCPDCEALLEKLQACGSASYFCHTCNELKSKSRVVISFQSAQDKNAN